MPITFSGASISGGVSVQISSSPSGVVTVLDSAVASTAAADNTSIVAMSDTQSIVVYLQGSNVLARTVNVSGSTITLGTDILVGAGSQYSSVTRLSATQALVGFLGSPSDRLQFCTLDISGTTITAGTMFTSAIYNLVNTVVAVSATQAMCVAQVGYTTLTAFTLNISGSTITAGATLSMPAVTNPTYGSVQCWATSLSSTQVIATYSGSNGYLEAVTLNISGTTVTAGSILVVNAVASSYYIQVTTLSATQALVTYAGTSGYLNACTLNISGTTVTAGTILITSNPFSWGSCNALSATQVITALVNSGLQTIILTISGNTVTAGTAFSTGLPASNYVSVTALSSAQAQVAYRNSSTTYTNTALLGIA